MTKLHPNLDDLTGASVQDSGLKILSAKKDSAASNPTTTDQFHYTPESPKEHPVPAQKSTPEVEWWDEKWYFPVPLNIEIDVRSKSYLKESFPESQYKVSCDNTDEAQAKQDNDMMALGTSIRLPKERRKERKAQRAKKAQQYREGIQRGDAIQHPPKLTMENIHGILKNKKLPAMDPLECEAMVVADQASRRQSHEERNQLSKKTPEQRSDQRRQKRLREAAESPHALFFEIQSMSGQRLIHKNPTYLKLILNIQQLHISGLFVIINGKHYLLAECGSKAATKLKTLLLSRMSNNIECKLLHESAIHSRGFDSFSAKEFPDIATAKT
eukprot:CAMPEP_0201528568 /NCGR_PEP_ID=MMETSP0161_2-20130828/38706_1 /ASSEMBLY_ACC=CAM_ASM_000251 /TAXON_ID=180227 /ORGANISM="Neoparamoeba aestuarina, Strain SoJaBio B1-5/56/2" /LENGTH=327 /DNA_ID=CAMNT_0047929889 /DNA_START=16 /DNA_END=995 /DNA_ORIENTATION=+